MAALSQAHADQGSKDKAAAKRFKNYLKMKKFEKSRSTQQKVNFTKTQSAYSKSIFDKKKNLTWRPPAIPTNNQDLLDDY